MYSISDFFKNFVSPNMILASPEKWDKNSQRFALPNVSRSHESPNEIIPHDHICSQPLVSTILGTREVYLQPTHPFVIDFMARPPSFGFTILSPFYHPPAKDAPLLPQSTNSLQSPPPHTTAFNSTSSYSNIDPPSQNP